VAEKLQQHLFLTEEKTRKTLPQQTHINNYHHSPNTHATHLLVRQLVSLVDSGGRVVPSSAAFVRRGGGRRLHQHVQVAAVVSESLHLVNIPVEGLLSKQYSNGDMVLGDVVWCGEVAGEGVHLHEVIDLLLPIRIISPELKANSHLGDLVLPLVVRLDHTLTEVESFSQLDPDLVGRKGVDGVRLQLLGSAPINHLVTVHTIIITYNEKQV
jgi:hypothetical protein